MLVKNYLIYLIVIILSLTTINNSSHANSSYVQIISTIKKENKELYKYRLFSLKFIYSISISNEGSVLPSLPDLNKSHNSNNKEGWSWWKKIKSFLGFNVENNNDENNKEVENQSVTENNTTQKSLPKNNQNLDNLNKTLINNSDTSDEKDPSSNFIELGNNELPKVSSYNKKYMDEDIKSPSLPEVNNNFTPNLELPTLDQINQTKPKDQQLSKLNQLSQETDTNTSSDTNYTPKSIENKILEQEKPPNLNNSNVITDKDTSTKTINQFLEKSEPKQNNKEDKFDGPTKLDYNKSTEMSRAITRSAIDEVTNQHDNGNKSSSDILDTVNSKTLITPPSHNKSNVSLQITSPIVKKLQENEEKSETINKLNKTTTISDKDQIKLAQQPTSNKQQGLNSQNNKQSNSSNKKLLINNQEKTNLSTIKTPIIDMPKIADIKSKTSSNFQSDTINQVKNYTNPNKNKIHNTKKIVVKNISDISKLSYNKTPSKSKVKNIDKLDDFQVSTFISDELQSLTSENDDIILGKLTEIARLDLLNHAEYIKFCENKWDYKKDESKRKIIDSMIKYYGLKQQKLKNLKKNEWLKSQAFNQAVESIHKNNIDGLRAMIDNYHVLNFNSNGNYLLHISVDSNKYNLSKFLIAKGSNLNIRNHHNQTAFDIAVANKNPYLVNLLYYCNFAKPKDF